MYLRILCRFGGTGKELDCPLSQKPNLLPFRELLCINSGGKRLDVGQAGHRIGASQLVPQFILGRQTHLSSRRPTLSIQTPRPHLPPAKHLLGSRGAFSIRLNLPIY